jgi:hypothetical protein
MMSAVSSGQRAQHGKLLNQLVRTINSARTLLRFQLAFGNAAVCARVLVIAQDEVEGAGSPLTLVDNQFASCQCTPKDQPTLRLSRQSNLKLSNSSKSGDPTDLSLGRCLETAGLFTQLC